MDEIDLEPWDDNCYLCIKPFKGKHEFVQLRGETYIIHERCADTLELVIKEMRHEALSKDPTDPLKDIPR